ncbi:hypothetical protein B9H04_02910 [Halorubrum ezzemoulense DSM 17463]|uniref:Uncharacterized protein n=1 Tax=Halorubrum ezzemoulense DSM 17463 TaxID=1121945 RepID=A0A1X4HAS4_HALEZ|nr:hypothetical protein [Halorubrum ezzemoulense]OSP10389.1 hypothetical protein B9H04_02910 [Halorubrum ezzemoulense DSM 17463]
MDITTETIDCDEHGGFDCVRYRFDYGGEDRALLDELRDDGERLAEGSDGRMARDSSRGRSADTQSVDGISGVLAEWVWKDWLTRTAERRDTGADVFQDDEWDTPQEQVDITVDRGRGESAAVEVRSSFPYTGAEKAVCTHFDVIGWYNNEVKKREIRKDYYVRVLFPFHKSNFWTEFESNSFDVYLAGGAPRAMLEDSPHAEDKPFTPHWDDSSDGGQRGTYRVISPIANAMDTPAITDEMVA